MGGAAITRPQDITRRFVAAVPEARSASLSSWIPVGKRRLFA